MSTPRLGGRMFQAENSECKAPEMERTSLEGQKARKQARGLVLMSGTDVGDQEAEQNLNHRGLGKLR